MKRTKTQKSHKHARKAKRILSIDDENLPYRGVKGKGTAAISEDPAKNLPIVEKICTKYLGGLDSPIIRMMVDMAGRGESVAVEITPRYCSTWDFGSG